MKIWTNDYKEMSICQLLWPFAHVDKKIISKQLKYIFNHIHEAKDISRCTKIS